MQVVHAGVWQDMHNHRPCGTGPASLHTYLSISRDMGRISKYDCVGTADRSKNRYDFLKAYLSDLAFQWVGYLSSQTKECGYPMPIASLL